MSKPTYMDKEEMRFSDAHETEKFAQIADQWWDQQGPFRPLHIINPIRVGYIRDMITQFLPSITDHDMPLSQLRILDIGCGGGILSESLARLGAKVTGVDATQRVVEAAKIHSDHSALDIEYRCQDINDMWSDYENYFDVVLNCEVVEHVRDPEGFLQISTKMVKKDGLFIASTLNRTLESYVKAIIGAEYVLRWLPKGTHDWHKFLTPDEMQSYVGSECQVLDKTGMVYNPLTRKWSLSQRNLGVNYMMSFKKI